MQRVYYYVFFLCFFIITGSFSLQYHVNNNSYDKYLNTIAYGNYSYVINWTWYAQAQDMNKKNLSYNPYLKMIFMLSMMGILTFGILVAYSWGELPGKGLNNRISINYGGENE